MMSKGGGGAAVGSCPLRASVLDFNEELHEKCVSAEPWRDQVGFFNEVFISAVALLKIARHAEAGCPMEVMGLVQGRMSGRSLIVTDALALPVEGAETRVNAAEDAAEFVVSALSAIQAAGRKENMIGWYHSHPDYGCWLSGIDVASQRLHQKSDPSVALVYDPVRSFITKRVDIGAFRVGDRTLATGKSDTTLAAAADRDVNSTAATDLPLAKARDFGAHWKEYYELPVHFYYTRTDEAVFDLIFRDRWVDQMLPPDDEVYDEERRGAALFDGRSKIGKFFKALTVIDELAKDWDPQPDKAPPAQLRQKLGQCARDTIRSGLKETLTEVSFYDAPSRNSQLATYLLRLVQVAAMAS